jgi:hypothetical protein
LRQRAANIGLEYDQQQDDRHETRGLEHPGRDRQVDLSGDECADAKGKNAKERAQSARLASPQEQEIERRREHDEINGGLPPEEEHR